MPNSFSITTPSNSALLGGSLQGRAVFTVTNISGRINRGRARIVPQNTGATPWLTLDGEAERDFPIASTQQFSVAIAVPPKSPPGSYVFHLEVVGVENPDEDLTQGPGVTFEVPTAAPPPKFPWWIFVVAGVVLIAIIAILIAVLSPKGVAVPDVSGITQAAAERMLQGDGFKVQGITSQPSGVIPKDLVLGTDPPAGAKADKGAGITIILSGGPLATATPTVTATAVITITPTHTATAVFTPTFTPTLTRTPVLTNLLASYPLVTNGNEANNLTAPMTLVNAPFAAGGVFCNGVYDGSGAGDYCKIITPNLTGFNFNNFSISARFRPAETKDMPVFMGGTSFRWIGFYLFANGHVGLLYNNSNRVDCGLAYSPGTFYQGMVTYDGTTAKLYVNNVLACTQVFTLVAGGDPNVGVTNYSNGGVFKGTIGDLRIYKSAIAP